jgi:hypothetical protein
MQNTHTPSPRTHRTVIPAPVPYDRARDLPRLIPLWPDELADTTQAGREALVARLAALLRRERQQGAAGAWSYDVARHRQLLIAWRAEGEALRRALRQRAITSARAPAHDRITPRGAFQAPSFSPAVSAPLRSSEQPWDSREAGSTSPDRLPERDCSAIADAASRI